MYYGKRSYEIIFRVATAMASFCVLFICVGIFYVLMKESAASRAEFGFMNFMFTSQWNPVEELYGGAASLFGTVVTTCLSLAIAIPIAIGIAVFITEVAPSYMKGPVGIAIELLAAIPSIVYGMWGLFTLAPLMAEYVEPALQWTFEGVPVVGALVAGVPMGIDLLTASVILSIMIIPFTASISRDAFQLTPEMVKESAYAMGATRWEVIKDVVVPYSKIGVFGGAVLSMGRALGETMAVAFVLGNNHEITSSLFDAAATITVALANEFTEADTDLYLSSLFNLALVLFTLSFITLAIAKFILSKAEGRHRG